MVVIFIIVLVFLNKTRSTTTFIASYNYMFKLTGSKEESLRKTISIFTQRPPFNTLSKYDIEILVKTFSSLKYPQVLSRVFLEADKKSDVSFLNISNIENIKKTALKLDEVAESQKWFD